MSVSLQVFSICSMNLGEMSTAYQKGHRSVREVRQLLAQLEALAMDMAASRRLARIVRACGPAAWSGLSRQPAWPVPAVVYGILGVRATTSSGSCVPSLLLSWV